MPGLGPALGWGWPDGKLEQEPQHVGGMQQAGMGQRESHCPDAILPCRRTGCPSWWPSGCPGRRCVIR